MNIKKTLKDAFVINGQISITPDNFSLFIRIYALVVSFIHVGYFVIMHYFNSGIISYFNIISVILYLACFLICKRPKDVASIFYASFAEIIVFSLISTCYYTNVTSFILLIIVLIPLACLMKFWQDSIFHETLFQAGRMVILCGVIFTIEAVKLISFPNLGMVALDPVGDKVLEYYNMVVVFGTILLTGVAFTSVSVHENRKSNDRFEVLAEKLVIALSETVEAKDEYTKGHSSRVAKYSTMIAERLNWSESEIKTVFYAGLLHDVGKIGILDTIINKRGGLSDEEFAMVKTHPLIGERILKRITEIPELMITAKYHHEHFDGKGYPDGLRGHNIPEIARLVGVADSYDAMTSNRSYRGIMAQQDVIREMIDGLGTQFDPVFGKVMLELIKEDTEYTMHE
ncbi:MAG: HD-GYP domain-containing protein [Treponema sp.]|nr:HD-GYP domain-containing protein [Treponema sp.]